MNFTTTVQYPNPQTQAPLVVEDKQEEGESTGAAYQRHLANVMAQAAEINEISSASTVTS